MTHNDEPTGVVPSQLSGSQTTVKLQSNAELALMHIDELTGVVPSELSRSQTAHKLRSITVTC
jgi:hypothetical protein